MSILLTAPPLFHFAILSNLRGFGLKRSRFYVPTCIRGILLPEVCFQSLPASFSLNKSVYLGYVVAWSFTYTMVSADFLRNLPIIRYLQQLQLLTHFCYNYYAQNYLPRHIKITSILLSTNMYLHLLWTPLHV